MYGIWDSRTNSFYSVRGSRGATETTLEEEVEDLAARGLAVSDTGEEFDHQLIETGSGQGRGVFGYEIHGPGQPPYRLVLVDLI